MCLLGGPAQGHGGAVTWGSRGAGSGAEVSTSPGSASAANVQRERSVPLGLLQMAVVMVVVVRRTNRIRAAAPRATGCRWRGRCAVVVVGEGPRFAEFSISGES